MYLISGTWIDILLISMEMPISSVLDDAAENISSLLGSLTLFSAA